MPDNTDKSWHDEPPPDTAGEVRTRYRRPSVHGGWTEEVIHIYTVFGGGTTRKYATEDDTGPLSDLSNRQFFYSND